jgi:hypothetical protein
MSERDRVIEEVQSLLNKLKAEQIEKDYVPKKKKKKVIKTIDIDLDMVERVKEIKKGLNEAQKAIDNTRELLEEFLPVFTNDFKGWSSKYKFYYDQIEGYKFKDGFDYKISENMLTPEEMDRLTEVLNIVDYWDGVPTEEEVKELKKATGQEVIDALKEKVGQVAFRTVMGELNDEATRDRCKEKVEETIKEYLQENEIKGEFNVICDKELNGVDVVKSSSFRFKWEYRHEGFETEEGRKVFRTVSYLITKDSEVKLKEI